jgi:hypothetical protein
MLSQTLRRTAQVARQSTKKQNKKVERNVAGMFGFSPPQLSLLVLFWAQQNFLDT